MLVNRRCFALRFPALQNAQVTSCNVFTERLVCRKRLLFPFHSVLLLAICAIGICGCFLVYGVVQEQIYTFTSSAGEKMSYTLFLLLTQVSLSWTKLVARKKLDCIISLISSGIRNESFLFLFPDCVKCCCSKDRYGNTQDQFRRNAVYGQQQSANEKNKWYYYAANRPPFEL